MLLNKTVLSLATLASKEESRWTLKGVQINKECAVVTNGHYLVKVEGKLGLDADSYPVTPGLENLELTNGDSVILSAEAMLAAKKALPKRSPVPVLGEVALGTVGEDKKAHLFVNTLESVQSFKAGMEGTFPNWQAVMPDAEVAAEIVLSAEYLVTLGKWFADHTRDAYKAVAPVRITIYKPEPLSKVDTEGPVSFRHSRGADRAVRFDAFGEDGQELTAVLMPIRYEGTGSYPMRPDEKRMVEAEKAEKAAQDAKEKEETTNEETKVETGE